ncbi:hypothetical protein ABWL39_11045 [Chitinivorax sp. PXF-14]|uniref:hypothetical protein n=1 Tax=Chitinivorax sp. PXF-14 TaxID=3230488 RepID=UPI003467845B
MIKQTLALLLLTVPMAAMADGELLRAQLGHEQARSDWIAAKQKLDDASETERSAQARLNDAQKQLEAAKQGEANARARLDDAQAKVDAAWNAGKR